MMHSISIKLIITSHSYSFSLPFLWYEGLRSSLSTCQYTVITMQCYYYRTPVDRSSAAAAAKSLQSRLTLCDPTDGSPPGSAIPGILQARTLEWGAISFSCAWKWKVKVKLLSRVRLLATPWTAAHQAPPSMGFSRQEYWSGDRSSEFTNLIPENMYLFHLCLYSPPSSA